MDESGKAAHSGSALIGNADMRLKNGPLIYPDRRRAAVAPAYDLLSTIPYIPDELSHLAAKAPLPERLVLGCRPRNRGPVSPALAAGKRHR